MSTFHDGARTRTAAEEPGGDLNCAAAALIAAFEDVAA
jgi:hypothetical protein